MPGTIMWWLVRPKHLDYYLRKSDNVFIFRFDCEQRLLPAYSCRLPNLAVAFYALADCCSVWVAHAPHVLVSASRRNSLFREVRDDETSSPTRETRAPPGVVAQLVKEGRSRLCRARCNWRLRRALSSPVDLCSGTRERTFSQIKRDRDISRYFDG
jgi:hypothetical protein